ncbi:MAG: hypothetical protein M0Z33_02145 [Actinomycetota bacterium]|nr:hypothetical protein [Actinomycetota bacterium]
MATRRRGPYIASQKVAVGAGVAAMVVAAFCFRDAWERRGRARPAAASWLGV